MNSKYSNVCLNDEELIQVALEGETLLEEKRKHLEQCKLCQQQTNSFKGMNVILLSFLYRSQCPTSMQVSSYCADLLSEGERFVVAAHMRKCPLCATEVEDTWRFLANVESIL